MEIYRINAPAIILIGTAGSGKSRLTKALSEAANDYRNIYATIVNMDPGVKKLPYDPDIDIRNYVTVDEFLEKGLGPNGAMMAAVDKIIEFIGPLTAEIKEIEPELIIVDTPGQMELFTHRPWGEFFVRNILGDRTVSVFLYDPIIASTPEGYVSLAFLDVSTRVRLRVTSLSALTKADLLSERDLERILEMASDPEMLSYLLKKENHPYAIVMRDVFEKFMNEILSDLIPTSAYDDPGVGALRGEIEEVLGLDEPR